MSASAAMESLESITDEVIEKFYSQYLQKPRECDMRRIISRNGSREFHGCLGSWK